MVTIARTKAGDKAVNAELKIRDVCTVCNNGPLSTLDTYICQLHDKYFNTLVRPGDRLRFSYDFDLLLRWLLKTGYNAARARKWGASEVKVLSEYILGTAARPIGFRVFLQLIVPTPVDAIAWQVRPEAEEIPPVPARVDLLDLQILIGFSMAFVVSLNSYLFHVFKEDLDASRIIRTKVLSALLRQIPGAYEITDANRAVLHASSVDVMTHLSKNRPLSRHIEMMKELKDKLKL